MIQQKQIKGHYLLFVPLNFLLQQEIRQHKKIKLHSSSDFIFKTSLNEKKRLTPSPLSLSQSALLVFVLSNNGIPHCPYTLRALKTLFFSFPTELPPKERHTDREAVVQNCWYTRKAMVPGSFVRFSGSGRATSVKKKKKPQKLPDFPPFTVDVIH